MTTTVTAVLVAHCLPQDFDAATQTCSAVVWAPAQYLLPPMSVGDALEVTAIIAGAWAIGYMIRQSRRAAGA